MRTATYVVSLLALTAAAALLVADSVGPCADAEPFEARYAYALLCDGEQVAEGSMWVANGAYKLDAAAASDGDVAFFAAYHDMNMDDCSPGRGTATIVEVIAEAEVWVDGERHSFACDVYPQADSVTCQHGPVRVSPCCDGDLDEEQSSCDLLLTAAE